MEPDPKTRVKKQVEERKAAEKAEVDRAKDGVGWIAISPARAPNEPRTTRHRNNVRIMWKSE